MKMLLLVATLLAAAAAFPFEITPQPVFPVPDPTPAEPCGMATRVCMNGADCASGFCNIGNGATTGCCEDTQWPSPGPQPTPPPFEAACPVNVPLCVTDQDCGFTGYCNHTEAHHNFFGCCQFGPGPTGGPGSADGPGPFPFPVTMPAPTGEICPPWLTVCMTDSDCSRGDSCSRISTNSDVFGCCQAGVAPSDGPFPFPVTAPAPSAEICPASITVCITDFDCSPGDSCTHFDSNSHVFGCCHAGIVDHSFAPYPFPDPSVGPVFPVDGPWPLPVTVPAPVAEICPAWITVCITDSDCSPGDSCSHLASNSDVFGCCHAGIVDPTFAPLPFPDPVPTPAAPFVLPEGEQPRCAVELSCLVDADCETFSGRCEFIFGSPMGCCTPNL